MINGLSTRIIKAKNELTALKTYHLHGLGSTQFYRYTREVTGMVPDVLKRGTLSATVPEGEPFPPLTYLAALVSKSSNLDYGIFSGEPTYNSATRTISWSISVAVSSGNRLNIAVTSSSRLTNVTWTAS